MKKYYVSGIIVIVLVVGVYVYLKNGVTCYDGYGSGKYVSRTELFQKIDRGIISQEEFSAALKSLNDNKIAFESYKCGDIDYLIKEGDNFKQVNKTSFQNFIDKKSSDLVKIWQSGNSPYFVSDLSTGKKYLFSKENGKYLLIEERRI